MCSTRDRPPSNWKCWPVRAEVVTLRCAQGLSRPSNWKYWPVGTEVEILIHSPLETSCQQHWTWHQSSVPLCAIFSRECRNSRLQLASITQSPHCSQQPVLRHASKPD